LVFCNAIAMGLMDTPMAVAGIAEASGQDPEAVRQARKQIKRELALLWWAIAGVAWFIRHGERRRAKAQSKAQRKADK
jgi:hypothetical protein